jgi:hypothetical protein
VTLCHRASIARAAPFTTIAWIQKGALTSHDGSAPYGAVRLDQLPKLMTRMGLWVNGGVDTLRASPEKPC